MDGQREAVRFLSFPRAGTGTLYARYNYLTSVKLTEIPTWCVRKFYQSHKPVHVPARGKDEKTSSRTSVAAGRTSFRGAIVMLKGRHHVASQHIQDILELCF